MAAGVNPVDTYIREGASFVEGAKLPFIPGSDVAGVIAAIGDGVNKQLKASRSHQIGAILIFRSFSDWRSGLLLPDERRRVRRVCRLR